MAQTPSNMVPLGSAAPPFRLVDAVTGRMVGLEDFEQARALLVMFVCNHCPFVKHVRAELARLGREYMDKGVGIVAISSNDIEKYPDDSPAKMREEAQAVGYPFPYLFDATQAVAKAYRAACTPDFFLYDRSKKLAYRGQLDDSRPSKDPATQIPVTGRDLRAALDAVLSGAGAKAPALAPAAQKPSIGCNIKWKPGNEPDYFKTG